MSNSNFNTTAFTNVTLGFINLETPRAFGSQTPTYSVTAFFDKATHTKLAKDGFKVKKPKLNDFTNKLEYSMELNSDAKSGNKPILKNADREIIDPSSIANGTKANIKVHVRPDERNPGKLVTTLMAIRATEIIAPTTYISQDDFDEVANSDDY